MKYYIFDIDDTLSNSANRRHHIVDKNGKKLPHADWDTFNKEAINDSPIESTVNIMNMLLANGYGIILFTGRSEIHEEDTIKWLEQHTDLRDFDGLIMRPVGDYQKDHDMKKAWFNMLPPDIKENVVAVFEDRNDVAEMWRSIGLLCYQVATGDY